MDVVVDIIAVKREGGELDAERIGAFVDGVVSGAIPAYQASALLMAIVLRGLSTRETIALTRAMVSSGKTIDLKSVGRPVLDKHSSGGVGDKVTLVLAPLIAACGAVFGKMSGRGLGHTGGTLDKLESIPGFKVQLPHGEFVRQLERIGVAVVSQSERVVPADRILYALRDVTGTIENAGLIAASIMSKKIASGTSALVLDLKVGSGAFMRDVEEARRLGALCADVAGDAGRRVTSIYTGMDAPLGLAIGNRIEVEEAWQVLCGQGPDDVREVTLQLAAALLALSDLGIDENESRRRAEAALVDGQAAATFERWCFVQGGQWKPGQYSRLAGSEVRAPRGGFVTVVDAAHVGRAAQLAGAGRAKVGDNVDPAAGVILNCRVGDEVGEGDLLATLFARDSGRRASGCAILSTAFELGETVESPSPLILGRG